MINLIKLIEVSLLIKLLNLIPIGKDKQNFLFVVCLQNKLQMFTKQKKMKELIFIFLFAKY